MLVGADFSSLQHPSWCGFAGSPPSERITLFLSSIISVAGFFEARGMKTPSAGGSLLEHNCWLWILPSQISFQLNSVSLSVSLTVFTDARPC